MTTAASPIAVSHAVLSGILLGALCVAAVAVLSLPQARAASTVFGWTPLWLLATPLSAWLALQVRRHVLRADPGAAPARYRRRVVAAQARRRATIGSRGARPIHAARAG